MARRERTVAEWAGRVQDRRYRVTMKDLGAARHVLIEKIQLLESKHYFYSPESLRRWMRAQATSHDLRRWCR